MNLFEPISSVLFFLILFWLVFAGSTTFSGEWIPPPIIIKLMWWLCGIDKDKEKDD